MNDPTPEEGESLSLSDSERSLKRKKKRPSPRPATHQQRVVEGERRRRVQRLVELVRSQMKRRV